MSIEFTCEATRESLIHTKTALVIFLTKYSRLSPAHKITLKTHFLGTTWQQAVDFYFYFLLRVFVESERQRKKIIFRVSEWKAGHKHFFSRYGVLCSLMFNTWATIRCESIFFRQQNMSPTTRPSNRMKDNWKIASASARIANQISTAPASPNDKTKLNLLTAFNGISTFTEPENQYFHTQRLTDTET